MAKKKIKRSVARSPMMQRCEVKNGHGLFASLTAIAFALFVITVWPAAMTGVHAVHWGYWLALTVILGIICKSRCMCK